jgi:hypothetical protein
VVRFATVTVPGRATLSCAAPPLWMTRVPAPLIVSPTGGRNDPKAVGTMTSPAGVATHWMPAAERNP